MKQTLACIGDKVESAVLIGEGFMPDGLQQKVATAHQALHLILLLQDQSKLLLHVYTPVYCAARYNTWLLIKLTPKGVVVSFLSMRTMLGRLWHQPDTRTAVKGVYA